MANKQPPYAAHFDANQVPSMMGVEGTLGTADTRGTANPLPLGVDPNTGAAYVYNLAPAGSLEVGSITVGNIDQVGTVGTNIGVGTVSNLGSLNTVTNVANISKGTITALSKGTISAGTINDATITALPDPLGSVVVTAGTVTTTLALNTGTITTGSLSDIATLHNGTVVVSAINDDINGGTIDLLSNITTGSLANIAYIHEIGTMPAISIGESTGGTLDDVTVTALPDPLGSVTMTVGTLTTGSLTNVATLHNGTVDVTDRAARDLGKVDIASFDVDLPGGTVDTVSAVTSVANLVKGTITKLEGGTLDALAVGTIGGKAASGAAAVANPVQIAGTDSGGTIYSPLVTSDGALTVTGASAGTVVEVNKGTINLGTVDVSALPDLPGGTVDLVTRIGNIGTIESGTVTTTLALNTGTITTIAAGTQNTLGTVGVVNSIVAGTQNTLGTVGVVNNLVKGTITKVEGGTLGEVTGVTTVSNLTNGTTRISVGTIVGPDAVAGTSNTAPIQIGGTTATGTVYGLKVDTNGVLQTSASLALNTGTITTIAAGTQNTLGTVGVVNSVAAGTQNTLGTVGTNIGMGTLSNLGSLNTVTNVANLTKGTITRVEGGTIGEVTGVTTVSNLTNGSVRMTVGTLTTGTLQNLVSGTINALASGTITAGTIRSDTRPVGSVVQSTHVLGTGGGTFVGTLVAPTGAGTILYLSGLSIVGRSGTADCGIANNVAGSTGAGVYARGKFNPGGGIARDFNPPIQIGTNGTLAYFIKDAGTADFTVNYIVST